MNGSKETYPTERVKSISELLNSGNIWEANRLALGALLDNSRLIENIERYGKGSYAKYVGRIQNNFGLYLSSKNIDSIFSILAQGKIPEAKEVAHKLLIQAVNDSTQKLEQIVKKHYDVLQSMKEPQALKQLGFDRIPLTSPDIDSVSNVSGITTDGTRLYVVVNGHFPDSESEVARIMSFLPDGTDKKVHLEEFVRAEEKLEYCRNLFWHNGGLYFLRGNHNNLLLRIDVDAKLPEIGRKNFLYLYKHGAFKTVAELPEGVYHTLQYDGKMAYVIRILRGQQQIIDVDLNNGKFNTFLDLPFEYKVSLSRWIKNEISGLREDFYLGDLVSMAVDHNHVYLLGKDLDDCLLRSSVHHPNSINVLGVFESTCPRLLLTKDQKLYFSGNLTNFNLADRKDKYKREHGFFAIDIKKAIESKQLTSSTWMPFSPSSMLISNGALYIGFDNSGTIYKLKAN